MRLRETLAPSLAPGAHTSTTRVCRTTRELRGVVRGRRFKTTISDASSPRPADLVERSPSADLALNALEQALWARPQLEQLVHNSDRGGQYLSTRYAKRFADAGIDASVGSVGDSYDNALAESAIGLFKTEVIRRRGPWRDLEAVEMATLE